MSQFKYKVGNRCVLLSLNSGKFILAKCFNYYENLDWGVVMRYKTHTINVAERTGLSSCGNYSVFSSQKKVELPVLSEKMKYVKRIKNCGFGSNYKLVRFR